MSIVKISQLNPASSVGTEDSLILLQSGLTLKTTADLLFDAVTLDRDLADKTYVNLAISSAVNSLINGAPTILDTLKELATAIGNDPNFAASIIAQINQKVSAADFNTLFSTQFATKTTTNLSEGTNKFYTDSRARSAITVEGAGSYNSTTGVITVVGGVTSVNSKSGSVTLTTTDIAEGSNKYYTDAKVRGAISTFGSFLSYDNSTGVISYDLEPTFDAVYLNSEITANKQAVTKEYVDNATSSITIPSDISDLTDITGLLDVETTITSALTSPDLKDTTDDFAGTNILNPGSTSTGLSNVATSGSYNDLLDRPTLFNGSYNSLTDQPDLNLASVARSGSFSDLNSKPSTADIPEGGTTNLYFTQTRARHSISATGGISYNEDTGIITTPTRLVDKPSSPGGSIIDKRGDYSIDGVDLYICNADYTDGNAFIWVKFSGTTSWS